MSDKPAAVELSAAKHALLERWRKGQAISVAPKIAPQPDGTPAVLTYRQMGMWLVEQLEPGTTINNQSFCVEAHGALDEGALEKSIDLLVRRHAILRTSFVAARGAPQPTVHPAVKLVLQKVDLRRGPGTSRPAEDGAREVVRRTADSLTVPFDVTTPPLVRATLYRLADEHYAISFVFHHIVFDGWSAGVVATEVADHYARLARGEDPSPPPLAIQFQDFAHWQRQQAETGGFARELAYWQQRLAPPPPVLSLPLDRPRPARPSVQRVSEPVRISADLTADLKALARDRGATPFVILLAAFQAFLSRLSGEKDVAVGAPVVNRAFPEVQPLIGPCFNMITLRSRIDEDRPFADLVARCRDEVNAAYSQQAAPIELVAQHLRVTRPIFTTSFAYQSFPFPKQVPGAVSFRPLALDSEALQFGSANLDLAVALIDDGNALTGYFEYSPEVFDRETVTGMVQRYLALVADAVAHDALPLSLLATMSSDEKAAVLVQSVGARSALDSHGERPGTALHELFEEQARRAPDAVAVVSRGRTLTYGQLELAAEQLACELEQRGIGLETPVVLCVERSAALVVALLAILKAGGAYVPLDHRIPVGRLQVIARDCQAAMILCSADLEAQRESFSVPLVALEELTAGAATRVRARRTVHADQCAYVMYTSGSTGRPKGVAVTHRAIVNHMAWMQREFPLGSDDAVFQKTPLGFDASVWEFYAPLQAGGRLVLADPDGERDGAYMLEAIQQHGVTVAQFVPTLLDFLTSAPAFERCTSLRRIFVGGETLPVELIEKAVRALPAVDLVNLYGPTEACIDATAWRCSELVSTGAVRIGRPIDHVSTYVLDERGRLAPPGVPGDLYIGGTGLARGYLGSAATTADRFGPDPFASAANPGARMYRTGDRARWRADRTLEFLGRDDEQIKLRGFRIELAEIEATLGRCHGVESVAVVHLDGSSGDGRLVGYVVPREGESLSISELRGAAARELPAYMVPATLVVLTALPLNASGKVDKSALRKRQDGVTSSAAAVTPASSEAEEKLIAIWREALSVDRIGIDDNFFELGGQSITLMRAHRAIVEAFAIDLPVADAFRHPTIRSLALRLTRSDAGTDGATGTDTAREASERSDRRREALARRRGRAG